MASSRGKFSLCKISGQITGQSGSKDVVNNPVEEGMCLLRSTSEYSVDSLNSKSVSLSEWRGGRGGGRGSELKIIGPPAISISTPPYF